MTANGYGASSLGDEKILELAVMAAQLCEYTENYQILELDGM